MALGSLVWDASATMIDVPLENAINMRSVWTAWFQFWGKPKQLLQIDVLFFRNILNVQHRIEWDQLDRLKKKHWNATTPHHRILCAKVPDGHLKFECGFYFKFDEYSRVVYTKCASAFEIESSLLFVRLIFKIYKSTAFQTT